jgi:uncharacterized protein YggE
MWSPLGGHSLDCPFTEELPMCAKRITAVMFAAGLFAVCAALYLPARGHVEFQDATVASKALPKRTIHSNGSATVRAKPDHARVFLSVQTTATNVKEARTQNGNHVNKVMNAIKGLGIADLKMKTTNLHVAPLYSQEEKKDKLPQLLGYRVNHAFTVLVRDDDIAKLSASAARVLDTALENGVNNVEQVVFFKEDLTAARRDALSKASADALANAKALASGVQETITEVANIDGSPEYRSIYQGNLNNAFVQVAGGDDTSFVAGEIEVSCRISITCNLVDTKK